MSNLSDNTREIQVYRKKVKKLFGDFSLIDEKVLTKACEVGIRYAKRHTKPVTGYLKRNWSSPRIERRNKEVSKKIVNSADYASFVNDGHRIVRNGITLGWVNGKFVLEGTIKSVQSAITREFKKEIEKLRRRHND